MNVAVHAQAMVGVCSCKSSDGEGDSNGAGQHDFRVRECRGKRMCETAV